MAGLIDDFLATLKEDLIGLAGEFGEDLKGDLVEDGTAFVNETKEDMKRWLRLLGEGELTPEDFEFLVRAKKDLAEMEALKQKGLAQAKLDRLKNGILDAVIGAAGKVV